MEDWTGAATGALSGAATGAMIGSVIPGIGTGIGAAGGGIVGGVAGLFGGGRKKKKKLSSLDKRQKQLNEQQYQGIIGEGPLADLYKYDPEAANAVFDQNTARPAQRNFQEKTVPGITGAFRKEGLQNSSYAGDALSKAGRDVQENLDALRSKYLYDEQKDVTNARRSAVDSLQNRQTFAYDIGQKPFDISSILNSLSPETAKQFKDFFTKEKTTAGVT